MNFFFDSCFNLLKISSALLNHENFSTTWSGRWSLKFQKISALNLFKENFECSPNPLQAVGLELCILKCIHSCSKNQIRAGGPNLHLFDQKITFVLNSQRMWRFRMYEKFILGNTVLISLLLEFCHRKREQHQQFPHKISFFFPVFSAIFHSAVQWKMKSVIRLMRMHRILSNLVQRQYTSSNLQVSFQQWCGSLHQSYNFLVFFKTSILNNQNYPSWTLLEHSIVF